MQSIITFDQAFDDITGLLHYPWVGIDYINSAPKMLVLGDSHYTVNDDGTFSLDEYNRCMADKYYTREILDCAVGRSDVWRMYDGLYKLFRIDPFTAEDRFWNRIAFYNFVQVPMKTRNAIPTVNDFRDAWFCLVDIIDVLKPDICLFVGIRGWTSNGYINSENKGLCTVTFSKEIISGSYPWKTEIKTNNGVTTSVVAIHHTSQGFNFELWRDYLTLQAPDMLHITDSQKDARQ